MSRMGAERARVILQAIFMFGEIDCREGLTMAVDKLKYDTLEAAMDVLLDIYIGMCCCSSSPNIVMSDIMHQLTCMCISVCLSKTALCASSLAAVCKHRHTCFAHLLYMQTPVRYCSLLAVPNVNCSAMQSIAMSCTDQKQCSEMYTHVLC